MTQRDRIRAKKAQLAEEKAKREAPDKDGYQFYSGYQRFTIEPPEEQ